MDHKLLLPACINHTLCYLLLINPILVYVFIYSDRPTIGLSLGSGSLVGRVCLLPSLGQWVFIWLSASLAVIGSVVYLAECVIGSVGLSWLCMEVFHAVKPQGGMDPVSNRFTNKGKICHAEKNRIYMELL